MSLSAYPDPLTLLEIDLAAVSHNYLFLKNKLAKGTDCGAVVKADGYGLGAVPVARTLEGQGCRHFFVASFEEGAGLRPALGADSRIYVLHGPYGGDFAAHGLTPVLNTLSDAEHWAGKGGACALHIDTGMNRLGLAASDLGRLPLDKLDLRLVMSHLACADTPGHPLNRAQLEAFRAAAAGFRGAPRLSLANSAGILLGGDWHFDLVRPGCGLYGINPLSNAPNPFRPVARLLARILQVRDIEAPGTVGYGATQSVSPPAKTAAISLGYADGYFRALSGGGKVAIGGKLCPVIGRVSMNLIVADITALDRPPEPGDWAEIFGAVQTADDVAGQAGTIGYEILTALAGRHQRVYTGA